MTNLKPVSAFERGLLEALGETPAQHQQQVLAVRKPSWLKGKKNPRMSAHEVYLKLQESPTRIPLPLPQETSSADLVANLVDPNWQADAYILFRRHQTCRHCHRVEDLQDSSQLFLRWHRRVADKNNSLVYTPVKVLTHQGLPRLVQVVFTSTPVCLSCFLEVPCQSPTTSSSPQVATSSSTCEVTFLDTAKSMTSNTNISSEPALSSIIQSTSTAPTTPPTLDGLERLVSTTFSDSHPTSRSEYESKNPSELAVAQLVNTHTDMTSELVKHMEETSRE